jgi:hypothetical protein
VKAGGNKSSASNGLHGVISQQIILFITTAVRTSNPTRFMWFAIGKFKEQEHVV